MFGALCKHQVGVKVQGESVTERKRIHVEIGKLPLLFLFGYVGGGSAGEMFQNLSLLCGGF